MERIYSDLKNEGRDMYTSTRNRLPERPTRTGGTAPFEDWGGTLIPSSQKKNNASGSSKPPIQTKNAPSGNSKFKPAMSGRSRPPSPLLKARGYSSQNASRSRSNSIAAGRSKSSQGSRPPRSTVVDVSSSEESPDELDLLSSDHCDEDDPSTSRKRVDKRSKSRPSQTTGESRGKVTQQTKEVFVDKSGQAHAYDPKFPPKKGLSGLKFNKIKKDVPAPLDDASILPSSLPSSTAAGVTPVPHPFQDNVGGSERNTAQMQDIPIPVEDAWAPPASQPWSSSFASPTRPQEPLFKENISSHTSNWPEIHIPDKDKEDDKDMDVASSSKGFQKDTPSHVSPLGTKCIKSNRASPPPTGSRIPLSTRTSSTSSSRHSENVASQDTPVAPAKPRPKPRPLGKKSATLIGISGPNLKKPGDGPSSSQLTGTSSLTKILDNVSGGTNAGRSRSRSPSVECSSPRKARPDDFPAISPPSSARTDPFATLSPLGSKEPPKPSSRAMKPKSSSSRVPQPSAFPMEFTPTKSKNQEVESTTTTRTRRAKEKAISKGKGKAQNSSDDNDDEDEDNAHDDDYEDRKGKKKSGKGNVKGKRTAKPKAFPMSTQVLASIGTRDIPSSSPLSSPRHGKRNSEGGSHDERASKRSRKERDVFQDSPSRYAFEDEGDSLLMSSEDPTTLCPYCDLPLPSNPSPLLLKLLASTKKKSQRDPRPYNPLGLKAPLTTFISVCQRHRFESQILPEAEKKGWPKTIEWETVAGRVMSMQSVLKDLIEDPKGDVLTDESEREPDEWEVGYARNKGKGKEKKPIKGPKARCRFWVDVMKDVKKQGLRAVSGVRGQFANFEKTQPGYYGEQGSVIIHQTLYNMFPLDSIDPTLTAPLTANQFIERILVPEVALRLIMEDKDLDTDLEEDVDEALEILRDSSSYGVAMFPEDGGEWGSRRRKKKGSMDDDENLGVGDLIVMERARKRRKELEEEDEREMEQLKLMEEKQRRETAGKEREKSKKKSHSKQSTVDQMEVADPPSAERPKPRPRPRSSALAKDSSAMSITDTPSDLEKAKEIRPSRGRTKSITRSRSRSVATVSDNGRRPSSEERRRSPSASESRIVDPVADLPTLPDPEPSHTSDFGWKSDASNRAVVNGHASKTRSRSRAPSRAKSRSRSTSVRPRGVREKSVDSRMDVEEDAVRVGGGAGSDDDDEVEVSELITAKTPVQAEKRKTVVDVDDEPTPKAPPRSLTSQPTEPLAPLEAARRRAALKKQESGNSSSGSSGERKHSGPPQLGMTRRITKAPSQTLGGQRERSIHRTASDVDGQPAKKNGGESDTAWNWLLDDTSQSQGIGRSR